MKDCFACSHSCPASDARGQIDFSKKMCRAVPPVPLTVLGPGNVPTVASFFPMVVKGMFCDCFERAGQDEAPERLDG